MISYSKWDLKNLLEWLLIKVAEFQQRERFADKNYENRIYKDNAYDYSYVWTIIKELINALYDMKDNDYLHVNYEVKKAKK